MVVLYWSKSIKDPSIGKREKMQLICSLYTPLLLSGKKLITLWGSGDFFKIYIG
jgi:hypothetical protein